VLKIISSPASKSYLVVTVFSATKLNIDIKIEMEVAIYKSHLNSFFIFKHNKRISKPI
jgi:hypothetical protein